MDYESTVCGETDYQCQYWRTDQQFSGNQIACYTPALTIEERKLLTSTNTVFNLSVEATPRDNSSNPLVLSCDPINSCVVSYYTETTPEIIVINPQYLAFGDFIQFYIKPKSLKGTVNVAINNPVEINLMEIKVGKNNCIYSNIFNNEQPVIKELIIQNERTPKNYNDSVVNCVLGDGVPESINKLGLNFMFTAGNPAIKSLLWKTGLAGEELIFKLFPKISSVTSLFPTLPKNGGSTITINGVGFIQSAVGSGISVMIEDDQNPCTVTSQTAETVVCTTSEISPALKTKVESSTSQYLGSPGFRYRKYDTNDCNAKMTETGFPDITATVDTVVLELSTRVFQGEYYLEYLNGWFVAPKSTDYKFYLNGDDRVQLYLTVNNTRTLIAQSYWSPYFDYTYEPNQISAWITLPAGNYYLEAYHCQGNGSDWFNTGMEMKEGGARRDLFSNKLGRKPQPLTKKKKNNWQEFLNKRSNYLYIIIF